MESAEGETKEPTAASTSDLHVDPAFLLSKLRALLPDDAKLAGLDPDDQEPLEERDAAKIDAGVVIWDLSADADAAAFMREHGLLELLLHPLARGATAHSARLLAGSSPPRSERGRAWPRPRCPASCSRRSSSARPRPRSS